MGNKVNIDIYYDAGRQKFVVDPGDPFTNEEIRLEQGDEVTFKTDGTDGLMEFTTADIFGDDEYVLIDNDPLPLTVQPTAQCGYYQYSILCGANGEYAVAKSPPAIIICADWDGSGGSGGSGGGT